MMRPDDLMRMMKSSCFQCPCSLSRSVCNWFVKRRTHLYVCVCVSNVKLAKRWMPVACGFWWRETAGCVKKWGKRRRTRPWLSPIHWLLLKVLTRCFQSDALCSSLCANAPAYNLPSLCHIYVRREEKKSWGWGVVSDRALRLDGI